MSLGRPRPWWVGWASVAMPACVLIAGAAALRPPEHATGRAAAVEKRLIAARPAVLVLGSSLVRMDVDVDALAEGLGVPVSAIQVVTIPNATAPHWYAILKNHVYDVGLRPKLVIVAGALTTMITNDVLSDVNGDRLLNLLGPEEPIVASKVFGLRDPWMYQLFRTRVRAGELRDRWVNGWRDVVVGGLFGAHGGRAEGARFAERVNETVFPDTRMDYALHGSSRFAAELSVWDSFNYAGLGQEHPGDSFVPVMADLAAEFGTRLVFVRTPFPPSNREQDSVSPEQEAAAARVMQAKGAAWIDLSGMRLDESHFQDMRHMNPTGAALFTSALADAVVAALSTAVEARAERPAPVWGGQLAEPPPSPWRARSFIDLFGPDSAPAWGALAARAPWRVLEPPVRGPSPRCEPMGLDAVGDPGCASGEAWQPEIRTAAARGGAAVWLIPGSSARWTVDRAAASRTLHLSGLTWGHDAPVRVRAGARTWEVVPARGRLWLDAPWPEGADAVEVEVAATGPMVLLESLLLGDERIAGSPGGDVAARMVGAKPGDTTFSVRGEVDPPTVVTGAPKRGPRGTGIFLLPDCAPLADAASTDLARPDRCSPFRVEEDGEIIGTAHALCADVAQLAAGRSCHAGDALYFSSSDGTDVMTNQRAYAIRLDPERLCDVVHQAGLTPRRGMAWVYPNDRLVVAYGLGERARLLGGADQLDVELERRMGPDAALEIRVEVDGVERARATLRDRAGVTQTVAIDPPILPDELGAVVRVTERGGAWWVIRSMVLRERRSADPRAPAAGARPVRVDPLGLLSPVDEAAPPVASGAPRWMTSGSVAWRADPSGCWRPTPDLMREPAIVAAMRAAGDVAPPVKLVSDAAPAGWLWGSAGCADCAVHGPEGTCVFTDATPPPARWQLDPNPIRQLGDGREVAWLVTDARLTWDGAVTSTEQSVHVELRARPLGEPGQGRPVVRACGEEQTVDRDDDAWSARVRTRCPSGAPWQVEVALPRGAAPWWIEQWTVADADGSHPIVDLTASATASPPR